MVAVALDQLLLLFLARVDDELETGVVAVDEEVQLDHIVLRDEEPTALDLPAKVSRTTRIVQRWCPIVNLPSTTTTTTATMAGGSDCIEFLRNCLYLQVAAGAEGGVDQLTPLEPLKLEDDDQRRVFGRRIRPRFHLHIWNNCKCVKILHNLVLNE